MSSLRLGTLETHRAGLLPRVKGQWSASGWLCFLPCAQGTALGGLARPFLFSGGKVYFRIGWEIHPKWIQSVWILTSPCSHVWACLAWLGPQGSAWETGSILFAAHSLLLRLSLVLLWLVFPPGSFYAPLKIVMVSYSTYFNLSEPQFPHL